jgi:hypothetical protein
MDKEEFIKLQKEALLDKTGICYPFTPDNVQESLCQMDDADANMLAAYMELAAKEMKLNLSTYSSVNLSDFVIKINKKYWEDMADHLARKEIQF